MPKNEYADKDFEKFLKEIKGKENMDQKPNDESPENEDLNENLKGPENYCLFFLEVLKEKMSALDSAMKTAFTVYGGLQKGSVLANRYEKYMEDLIKISIETVKEFDNLMGE